MSSSSATRLRRSSALRMPLTSSGSAMMSAMPMRGLSEENGSWNTICMWRR
jgi:hypothetical protein